MGVSWPSRLRRLRPLLGVLLLMLGCCAARAEVIFDVFVGYGLGVSDGCVAEASWYPVTCEVQNNGPGFNGVVEIVSGQGARRAVRLELPTGTKKRLTIPIYCGQRSRVAVDAALRNEKGKVIAEHRSLEPRMQADSQSTLVAQIPRRHGAIILPELTRKMPQYTPGITHLKADTFPENPIALEGLNVLYLHSTRAVDLKMPQVNALLAWLHGGGRLVLAVEQPGDVKAVDWLQSIIPCELGDVLTNTAHGSVQQWLTRPLDAVELRGNRRLTTNVYAQLSADAVFEAAPMPVTAAKVRDGEVLAGSTTDPLMVSARRGRGELIVLLFSPELAPFNEWSNRNWFWSRLGQVPAWWLAGVNPPGYSSTGMDGVFGAMVDSRQIRKLPIGWLLLLLIVYLIVIGPLDQYWLKKINKQMLTWVTFPTYVVVFSGLIYFIGYTLRSGETEYNELQVVDIVPHGGRADLRGRTYGSAYSPLNARYSLASDQAYATFRGEVGNATGEQGEREDVVEVQGNTFTASVTVPVWTSQLYVHDWWRQDAPPLDFSVTARGSTWDIEIISAPIEGIREARLIIGEQVYRVHEAAGFRAGKRISVSRSSGQSLVQLVQNQQGQFSMAVNRRQSQFGSHNAGFLDNVLESTTAASFMSVLAGESSGNQDQPYGYQHRFTPPKGFDLSEDVRRGAAVLIAFAPNKTVAAPINKFTPRMSKKDSVLRVIKHIE